MRGHTARMDVTVRVQAPRQLPRKKLLPQATMETSELSDWVRAACETPFVIERSYIVRPILFNVHILHEDLNRNTIEELQVSAGCQGCRQNVPAVSIAPSRHRAI
jgi:hypothetical protein